MSRRRSSGQLLAELAVRMGGTLAPGAEFTTDLEDLDGLVVEVRVRVRRRVAIDDRLRLRQLATARLHVDPYLVLRCGCSVPNKGGISKTRDCRGPVRAAVALQRSWLRIPETDLAFVYVCATHKRSPPFDGSRIIGVVDLLDSELQEVRQIHQRQVAEGERREYEQSLTIACPDPLCRAAVGQPCTARDGTPYKGHTHHERRDVVRFGC